MSPISVSLLMVLFFLISPLRAEDRAAAKVNGVSITENELEQAVDKLIPRSTYHGNVSETTRSEFREKAIENLIDRELQYQDAVSKGMKPDKKLVKEQLVKIREPYSTKKDFKKALEQSGLTEDTLRLAVEKNVLVKQVVERMVTEPSHMPEDEIKAYYDKNLKQFMLPDSVKLRLIACKDESKAKSVHAKVIAGEDFGSVAASMSEDKYRIKGGDVGYIHRGRLLQEIEDVAFDLKIGEVGGPIRAEGTWYIIKLEDREPGRQVGFDEIKSRLKQQLEAKREQELMNKWVAELRSKVKIEIMPTVAP